MKEIAMQIRADGTKEIYRGGRQYLRVSGNDAEPRWLKRTSRGIRPVSKSRARQLERIYRHPERAKAFRRFPRLPAEDIAAEAKAALIVELETRAFDWIARGHAANIQLGRVFLQLKELIGHGRWEAYFIENFVPSGIALRKGQLYMQMAKDADSDSANIALFPPATDSQVQEIEDANEEARAAVAIVDAHVSKVSTSDFSPHHEQTRKRRIRLDGVYKLPLYMTGGEKDATDQLLESEDWKSAEMELLGLLRSLLVKHGIVNDSEERGSEDSTDAREETSSNEDNPA